MVTHSKSSEPLLGIAGSNGISKRIFNHRCTQINANNTRGRKCRLLIPVIVGLDRAIGYTQPIANDAIPINNHPMKMTVSSPVMTGSDHCVRYVNSKGHWYNSAPGKRGLPDLKHCVWDYLCPSACIVENPYLPRSPTPNELCRMSSPALTIQVGR
jgi:hypothetical protein